MRTTIREDKNEMRGIKFRAWDEKRNKMIGSDYPDNWDNDKDEWYADANKMDLVGIENISKKIPVMQYIGRKDIQGQDIYEHDIVKDWEGIDLYEVVFDTHYTCYQLRRLTFANDTEQELDNAENDLKIIGNIYENPEFLKGKHE